ncbi:MAG: hypothetical protein GY838_12870 [bacterium]|nr:hypothetical protein [bacterium]
MATKKTNGTNNARIRHTELRKEIETQISRIQGCLNANPGADWADVGDLAQVLEDVKNAANFINGTNDED